MTHFQRLEYQKKYHKEHKEQEKSYYEKNKEKINAYSKQYYQEHKWQWKEIYSPQAQVRAIIKGAKKMIRVYLSGKITGREKADYTMQFAKAEQFYKAGGFEVVNPVKIGEALLDLNPKAKYEDFMIRDLEALSTCTHIALLEGWQESKGAMREKKEAERLGLEVMYLKLFGKGKK